MAKFSAEDLSSRINELELDDEVKISLMEDVTDSISNEESEELVTLKAEMEELKLAYEDLKEKYKARFLKAVSDEESEVKEEEEDLEEKEVVDVKDI